MYIAILTVNLVMHNYLGKTYRFAFGLMEWNKEISGRIKSKYKKQYEKALDDYDKRTLKIKMSIKAYKVEDVDLSFWPDGGEAVINPINNENDEKND